MKVRKPYKGHVIEAMSFELTDGPGFVSELFIERHDGEGLTVTQFFVPGVFKTSELAIQTAVLSGKGKVDVGYEIPACSN
jgi:hypothetical protein